MDPQRSPSTSVSARQLPPEAVSLDCVAVVSNAPPSDRGLTNHKLLRIYNASQETTQTLFGDLICLALNPQCTLQHEIGLVPRSALLLQTRRRAGVSALSFEAPSRPLVTTHSETPLHRAAIGRCL